GLPGAVEVPPVLRLIVRRPGSCRVEPQRSRRLQRGPRTHYSEDSAFFLGLPGVGSNSAESSTVPCFFCSKSRLIALRMRVLVGPLTALPTTAASIARCVTGRPLRGFLAASPSFFLLLSSLLRACALARRIWRSGARNRSRMRDAASTRRG